MAPIRTRQRCAPQGLGTASFLHEQLAVGASIGVHPLTANIKDPDGFAAVVGQVARDK